jgi:hypothetical protein
MFLFLILLFESGSSLQLLTQTLDFLLTLKFALTVLFLQTVDLSLMLLFSLTLPVSLTLQLSPHVVVSYLTVSSDRVLVGTPPLSPLLNAVSTFLSLHHSLLALMLLSKLFCPLAFLLLLFFYFFMNTSPIGHD